MTFKNQMEKAIKEYLAPLGFKYNAKKYAYIRYFNEDLTQSISYADENHYRKHYYFLRTSATVTSNLLNIILYEVTDGLMDYRGGRESPAYLNTLDGKEVIHTEFMGERPMEENIADFDRMYKKEVLQVFDKFKTTKDVFLCPLREEFFNPYNRPYVWYYVPLAFYFNSEFDKAFEYIQERLDIEYKMIERFGPHESATQTINIYEAIRKNLKQWIAERRQFKIDDEYLPIFNEQEANSLSESLQKMKSIVGKLLKNE